MTETDVDAARATRDYTVALYGLMPDVEVERRAGDGDRLAQHEHWLRTGEWR